MRSVFKNNQKASYSLFNQKRNYSDNYPTRFLREITSVNDAVDLVKALQEKMCPLLQISDEQKNALRMSSNTTKKFIWFRGHSDVSFDLEPGVFRKQFDADGNATKFDEHNAIMHLSSIQPKLRELNLFDFLAVAQHQSLPTRLLDWTKNILIGLYFTCCEHHDKDGELIILNPSKLNYYSYGRYGVLDSGHIEVLKRAQLAFSRDYKGFLVKRTPFGSLDMKDFEPENPKKENSKKKVSFFKKETGLYVGKLLSAPVATHPVLRDHRLVVQQGMFTIHGGKEYFPNDYIPPKLRLPRPVGLLELQDSVIQKDGDVSSSSFITSALISKKNKAAIMSELELLGINRAYVFPEVEYQAKYVREFWYYQEEAGPKGNDLLEGLPSSQSSNKHEKDYNLKENKFIEAIKRGDKDFVALYLKEDNHNSNSIEYYCLKKIKDTCGCSPLYQAASFGRKDIVSMFLIDLKDRSDLFRKTANPKKSLQLILDQKTGDNWTPLYAAVFYNHTKVAEKLLDYDFLGYTPDLLVQNKKGDTLLHHAARNNCTNLVHKLINNGADPLARNNKEFTPIHYACRYGAVEALEVLIEDQKDLNLTGNPSVGPGRNPLQEACANGRASVVEFLLAKAKEYKISIDIDYRNADRRTAFDLVMAVVQGREDYKNSYVTPFSKMKEILQEYGASKIDVSVFRSHRLNELLTLIRKIVFLKDDLKNSYDRENPKISDFEKDLKFKENLKQLRSKLIKKLKEFEDEKVRHELLELDKNGFSIVDHAVRLSFKEINSEENKEAEIITEIYNLFKVCGFDTDFITNPNVSKNVEIIQMKNEIALVKKLDEFKCNHKINRVLFVFMETDNKWKVYFIENKFYSSTSEEKIEGRIVNDKDILEKLNKLRNDGKDIPGSIRCSNSEKETLFKLLFKEKEVEKSKKSIENAKPMLTLKRTTSPLYEACFFGLEESVKALLEKEACVEYKRNCNDWTPLMVAVWSLRLNIVNLLLGALKDKEQRKMYVHEKSKLGNQAISIAVDNFSLISGRDVGLESPSKEENDVFIQIIRKLVESEAVFDIKDLDSAQFYYKGNNLLHIAARYNASSVIDIIYNAYEKNDKLRDFQTLLNERNELGATPLIIASFYWGYGSETAEYLRKKGANESIETKDGKKASDFTKSTDDNEYKLECRGAEHCTYRFGSRN